MRRLLQIGVLSWAAWQWSATAAQVWIWQDDNQLWSVAVVASPHKPRPHINYGAILEAQEKFVAAEAEYRIALDLSNSRRDKNEQRAGQAHAYATTRLARVLSAQMRLPDAVALLDEEGCPGKQLGASEWIWRCHTDR